MLAVHLRSLPRPVQVTFGSLAVQAEALLVEVLHEVDADDPSAGAGACGR